MRRSVNLHLLPITSMSNFICRNLPQPQVRASLRTSLLFTPERAISSSKHMDFKTPYRCRADSVIALFKNHGFTETQVSDLVRRLPKILTYDPEKTLLPKLEFFSSIGLSTTDLPKFITGTPRILQSSLEKQVIPSFCFIRNLIQSDVKTITAIKRFPMVLVYDLQNYAAHNVQILRELGVPKPNIAYLLTQNSGDFMTSTDNFRRIVEEVKEMGFNPSTVTFVGAIHALRAMSKSTWEKKVELYKKWGWSEDEIFMAFRKHPGCMMASEDKITRVLDFLVNKMGCETSFFVNRPILVSLSLEKRIVPRCLLYQDLVGKGLVKKKKKKDFQFISWLFYTEIKFLNMITKMYEKEAPELLKLYQEKLYLTK